MRSHILVFERTAEEIGFQLSFESSSGSSLLYWGRQCVPYFGPTTEKARSLSLVYSSSSIGSWSEWSCEKLTEIGWSCTSVVDVMHPWSVVSQCNCCSTGVMCPVIYRVRRKEQHPKKTKIYRKRQIIFCCICQQLMIRYIAMRCANFNKIFRLQIKLCRKPVPNETF